MEIMKLDSECEKGLHARLEKYRAVKEGKIIDFFKCIDCGSIILLALMLTMDTVLAKSVIEIDMLFKGKKTLSKNNNKIIV